MDFDFSDDQEMLRDTVRKWVEKSYDFERRRGIVKSGGFSRESWQGLADLGVLGLAVPEAQGGMGFGPVDAMVVMEELGRGLVLEPFAAVSLVATHLLAPDTPRRRHSGFRASPRARRSSHRPSKSGTRATGLARLRPAPNMPAATGD